MMIKRVYRQQREFNISDEITKSLLGKKGNFTSLFMPVPSPSPWLLCVVVKGTLLLRMMLLEWGNKYGIDCERRYGVNGTQQA